MLPVPQIYCLNSRLLVATLLSETLRLANTVYLLPAERSLTVGQVHQRTHRRPARVRGR